MSRIADREALVALADLADRARKLAWSEQRPSAYAAAVRAGGACIAAMQDRRRVGALRAAREARELAQLVRLLGAPELADELRAAARAVHASRPTGAAQGPAPAPE